MDREHFLNDIHTLNLSSLGCLEWGEFNISIPWFYGRVSVKAVCTSMAGFTHAPIWNSRTHLVKSPHSLLEYLLKTKIRIQLVR